MEFTYITDNVDELLAIILECSIAGFLGEDLLLSSDFEDTIEVSRILNGNNNHYLDDIVGISLEIDNRDTTRERHSNILGNNNHSVALISEFEYEKAIVYINNEIDSFTKVIELISVRRKLKEFLEDDYR